MAEGDKVADELSLTNFFLEGKEPICYRGGFMREKLSKPWNKVFLMLMKYLMLKGRYGVYYYYHFPLLNNFHHHDHIFIPFFLLHDLIDAVVNVKDKMRKGVKYTILHQGLMFHLYQFHLALLPLELLRWISYSP